MTWARRRGVCHCCKREVAFRFAHNNNKARMPHRCPHGQECAAGVMPNAKHINHPKCGDCANARRAERGEPPLSRDPRLSMGIRWNETA